MGLVGQAIMGSAGILPTGLPPRWKISRVWSAAQISDSPSQTGRMFKRVRINGRTVWNRPVLDTAFAALSDDANDNDRAVDLVPQGGISSFLPTITRESSLTTCAFHGGRQGPPVAAVVVAPP